MTSELLGNWGNLSGFLFCGWSEVKEKYRCGEVGSHEKN